jgi:uncharacterized protein (TIGR02466 family)
VSKSSKLQSPHQKTPDQCDAQKTKTKGQTYQLFATPVRLFELEASALNASLKEFFNNDSRFKKSDQAERSDEAHLPDIAKDIPALQELRSLFLECFDEYCREIGWLGEFDIEMQMFPNVAPKGHYVPSHNHVSHISAVYYVDTQDYGDRPSLIADETISEYWRVDDGVLILHDPRFNSSLNGGWHKHAKIYPKPGMMIFFPSFLWHEVSPHNSDTPRLSVAANFTLTYLNVCPYNESFKRTIE